MTKRSARVGSRRATQTPFLDELLGPRSSRLLLAHHWPTRDLACRVSPGWRRWIDGVRELRDVGTLLAAWRAPVTVIMPYSDDEHESITVPAADAAKLYRAGMSLAFPEAEKLNPELHRQLYGLAHDLGLPSHVHARCIVYASPVGRGAGPHFDANANFAIQLRGRKRWGFAANTHVAFPTDRFAVGMAAIPDRLAPYTPSVPAEMPATVRHVEVGPGDHVYVPRGTWHETEARSESLSLNFTFSQPTWAEFLLRALVPVLTRDSTWRQLADGITASEPGRSEESRRMAVEMTGRLARVLGTLDASDLVTEHRRRLASEHALFRRSPGTQLRIREKRTSVYASGRRVTEFDTDAELAMILSWIQASTEPFRGSALATVGPVLSEPARHELLTMLVATGVVERID